MKLYELRTMRLEDYEALDIESDRYPFYAFSRDRDTVDVLLPLPEAEQAVRAWEGVVDTLKARQKTLNQKLVPTVAAMIQSRIDMCKKRRCRCEIELWQAVQDNYPVDAE